MTSKVATDKLKTWVTNFKGNDDIACITTSALIKLSELEDYVREIKGQGADGVRIYFVRYPVDDTPTSKVEVAGKLAKGCVWKEAGKGLTQAGIAMVPVKNFDRDAEYIFSGEDIVINREITTLIPGTEGEGTGMNPPGASGIESDHQGVS